VDRKTHIGVKFTLPASAIIQVKGPQCLVGDKGEGGVRWISHGLAALRLWGIESTTSSDTRRLHLLSGDSESRGWGAEVEGVAGGVGFVV